MLLEQTCRMTKKYVDTNPKHQRKSIGQFFTSQSTASFMASMISNKANTYIKILDAGAGTGVLSASLLDKLFEGGSIKTICLDLYENDSSILPTLQANLDTWKSAARERSIQLIANIYDENFIVYNREKWNDSTYKGDYDVVISNPPYKKISKSDIEAQIMSEVVHGQPNLYFLFMAMSCKLLKPDGELIYIVPRSWTSGLYFSAFRRFFLEKISLEKIHLFVSRDKVFSEENVLQETMILKALKSNSHSQMIEITSSHGDFDFLNKDRLNIPRNVCISNCKKRFVFLPTSQEDASILHIINSFENTLETMGLRLKTGVTVDFRSKEWLRDKCTDNTVPLFWATHFKNGFIQFPISACFNQFITIQNKALLMKNTNYLLLKRFSSKEELRRLQPAVYLYEKFHQYPFVSTENHINFIERSNGELSVDEIFGLYVIFGSTLWDKYYRILNGSTQVNASEINSIPMPSIDEIRWLGSKVKSHSEISTAMCDVLVEELLNEKGRSQRNIEAVGYARETAS